MDRFVSQAAFRFYAGVIFLLPFIVIPFIAVPTEVQKGMIAAFGLGLALVGGAIALFFSRVISVPRSAGFAAVGLPFFLIALISACVSVSIRYSIWGTGFEFGTAGSFLFFAAAIGAGTVLTRESVVYALDGFLSLIALTALYYCERAYLTPSAVAGGTFVGAWTQLPFFFGLSVVVALVLFDRSEKNRKVFYAVIAAISVLSLVLFSQVTEAAVLAFLFLFAVCALSYFSGDYGWRRIIGCALGALFLLIFIGSGVRSPLQLPAQGRLSIQASGDIVISSYSANLKQALLGTGPFSYSYAWELYRPAAFDTVLPIGTTITDAYSTAFTFAVTLGSLGLVALLLAALMPIAAFFFRVMQGTQPLRQYMNDPGLVAGLVLGIFPIAAAFVYSIGLPLFLVAGIGIGFFLGALFPEPAFRREFPVLYRAIFAGIVFLLGAGIIAIVSFEFFAAETNAQGLALLNASNYPAAEPLLELAANAWREPSYEIDASQAAFGEALALSSTAGGNTPNAQAVQTYINKSKVFSGNATKYYKLDYNSWLWRASLLTNLTASGVSNSASEAESAVKEVHALGPTEVQPLYIAAELAAFENDAADARTDLQNALLLDPNYTDASTLLAKLPQ